MNKRTILQLFIVFLFQNISAQFTITGPVPDTVCQGETAMFQVMVSPTPDSIRWQYADAPNNGEWNPPSIGTDRLDTTQIHVFNTQLYDQKFFRIVVWEDGMIKDSSESALLTVDSLPIAEITPNGLITFCQGNSVTLTASLATLYAWSSGETMQSITVYDSGSYSVTVTDSNGCSSSSSPTTVTVNPLPNAIISPSGPTTFCQGSSVTLTANPENSYLWSNGDTVQSIIVTETGEYSVTVTSGSDCSSVSSVTSVIVNLNPKAGFFSIPELTDIEETESIQFKDTSSASPSSIPLTKWEWNFGECSSISPIELNQPIDPPIVSYSCQGLKFVCLKVTDINTCVDSICRGFVVNPADAPTVTVIQKGFPAKCLGDEIILEATAINSNQANFTFNVFDWEVLFAQQGDYEKNVSIINPSNSTRIEQCTLKFFQPGVYNIQVTATQVFNIDPDSMLIGIGTIEINSGNLMPTINQSESIVPDSICVNSPGDIILILNTNIDTKVEYELDGLLANGTAVNGELVIPFFGQSADDVIYFNVVELQETGNDCINASPEFNDSIFIKSAPDIVIKGDTILCKGSPSYLTATGPDIDSYIWRNTLGEIVSQSDTLYLEAGAVGITNYSVEGAQQGCASSKSVTVDVREPPSPVIQGNNSACDGQVVSYTSNSDTGNSWFANGGSILGSNSEQQATIKWNSSGSLMLKQEVGVCESTTTVNVAVSDEESPPYDTLEYLSGGGILLYPNPGLVPNLCYRWFKDGQLLPDTFQGCVVGTDLDSSELARYSVEVSFCGQSDECAQVISYRAYKEVSVTTDFKFKVVPNPNDGAFTLEYEIPMAGSYIQYIFNSSGQLIHKEKVVLDLKSGKMDLSLPNVESGIYFIKMINSTTGDFLVVPVSILH